MPTVGDMARVTIVSGEMPADEVAKAAWMLWKSVRTEIDRKRLPAMNSSEGVAGNRLDGSLVKHIISLWPEYMQWAPEVQLRFKGSLYSYLKGTNNAHCLSPTKNPIWWISQNFSKIAIQKVFGGSSPRSRQQKRAEDRLTPHEAGEDRDPAPVTVLRPGEAPIFMAPAAAQPPPVPEPPERGPAAALKSIHETRREQREHRRAAVLKVVNELKEPATVEEIGQALSKGGFNHEVSTIRGDLNGMLDSGVVFARIETREERTMRSGGVPQKAQRARLFWPKDPVPARTLREVVPGFVVVAQQSTTAPDRKARWKATKAVARQIRRAPFSALELAELSGVAIGTMRHYLHDFAEEGLIGEVPTPDGKSAMQKYYRVARTREDDLRQLGKLADSKLAKNGNGNGNGVHPVPVAPVPPAPPAPVAAQTPAERDAIRIIEVIQDEGTQRENVLMAKVDLERDAFNQAVQLLIAGQWLKRFEVSGQIFYGAEEPVISEPPPSVATAKITELEAAVDLEQGFALIRQAFESKVVIPDPRIPELEAEIAALRDKLRKTKASLDAALEG